MDKPTILIIDDTPANLKTLAAMLKEDYRIIISKSGEEALNLLAKGDYPGLILLDIMMPGMNGYEVFEKLQQNKQTKGIPVMFITAKSEAEEKRKGLSMGAAAYITKPFNAKRVKQAVNDFFLK